MNDSLPLFDPPPVDHPFPPGVPAKPRRRPRTDWNWPQLCIAEPELRFLETNVRMQSTLPFDHLWEHHKRRMKQLVGDYARNAELISPQAYDVAYRHLLEVFEQTHSEKDTA